MHLYLYLYLYGTTSRPLGESRIPFDGPFLCCCGNRLERGAVWLTLGAHVLFPPSELNSGCAGGARVRGPRFVAPWWRSSEGPAGGRLHVRLRILAALLVMAKMGSCGRAGSLALSAI